MIFAALLLAAIPHSDVVTEAVDLIEVNHFFDEQGRKVYDQVLFWDWNDWQGEYEVVAWRMLKTERQRPRREGKIFITKWMDTQEGDVWRCVMAKAFRETWTQHDPELREREKLSKEKRRGLSKPLRVPVMVSGERVLR